MISEEHAAELLARFSSGDRQAGDELIEAYLPLIKGICRRFIPAGEMEDLVQLGCLGLIKALARFDRTRGVKFLTYAMPYIIGEIKRYLRDKGSLLKISRSMQEKGRKAALLRRQLRQEWGREPTVGELASELGLPATELAMLEGLFSNPVPLEETAAQESLAFSEEQIVSRVALKDAFATLTFRERQIIVLRYFKDKSQNEVAGMLNISQVHVSRLERRILDKLRRFF